MYYQLIKSHSSFPMANSKFCSPLPLCSTKHLCYSLFFFLPLNKLPSSFFQQRLTSFSVFSFSRPPLEVTS